MAITSEIIGKLGGADIETIAVNRLIVKGESWQILHTFTVDKPSLVAIIATHDNTDSFGNTNTKAALALRGTENVYYGTNYGVIAANGNPLSMTAELSAGTWDLEAVCNTGTGISSYTVEALTLATINL